MEEIKEEEVGKKIDNSFLLGKRFPFFMNNNGNLSERFYLYEVYSPGVDEKLNPYVSITKVGEKSEINLSNKGKDTDIISTILFPKKTTAFRDYVEELMKREEAKVTEGKNQNEFPYITAHKRNGYLAKALIVNLRNNLRYSNYRIFDNKKIDILISPDTFALCTIHDNGTSIWVEPDAVYKNDDALMKSPLDVKITKEDLNIKVEKSQTKAMASLLYEIRAFEKKALGA